MISVSFSMLRRCFIWMRLDYFIRFVLQCGMEYFSLCLVLTLSSFSGKRSLNFSFLVHCFANFKFSSNLLSSRLWMFNFSRESSQVIYLLISKSFTKYFLVLSRSFLFCSVNELDQTTADCSRMDLGNKASRLKDSNGILTASAA